MTTLLGAGAVQLAPEARAWWDDRQFERELRQADEDFAPAKPAAAVLGRIPLPDGTSRCADWSADAAEATGMLCWQSDGTVVPAAAALAGALRAAGATAVLPSCYELKRLGAICRVSADVLGHEFTASVGPQIDGPGTGSRFHGAHTIGGVGPFAETPLPIPARATPIPVPR